MEIEDILPQVKKEVEAFRKKHPNGIVIIRWATATGKSKLSVLLSKYFNCEIISADSRQIFKHMDIWTDKVPMTIRKKIPHHQIDIIDPNETYTAGQWKKDSEKQIEAIFKRKKLPLIVGGTWLYIDTIYKNFTMPEAEPNEELRKKLYAKEEKHPGSLHEELKKIDPKEAEKIHPKSIRYLVRALEIFYTTGKSKSESFLQQKVTWPILMIWLRRNKEDSNKRIDNRIHEMIENGLIKEVKWLLKKWYSSSIQSMQGIGYKETIWFLEQEYDLNTLEELMKKNTHQLAKKQRTWFRRYIHEWKENPKENVIYKVWDLSN